MKVWLFRLLGKVLDRWEKIALHAKGVYRSTQIVGKGTVGGDTRLAFPQNICIGQGTRVNGGMLIASPKASIKIGDNCQISYAVHLRTSVHLFRDASQTIVSQGGAEADIIIGNDVWVGYGVQIMAGICVGDGAVVGAGAIVTHDVAPYDIVAGVPAKVIGRRT